MHTRNFNYQDGDVTCHGYLASQSHSAEPTVIVIHEFAGITNNIKAHVEKIARFGYTAVAIDMYGEGKIGKDFESCVTLFKQYFNDRALLQRRVLAGFNATRTLPEVNKNKIAAVGFCFGGMCALDLARAGADVKGVASIHGLFLPPENVKRGKMTAKVLICQGYDDPQVPHDQLHMLAKELNENQVDWQFVYFSHTKHSFTDPEAAKLGPLELGRVYNATSADRAWVYCHDFFDACLH